MWYVDVSDFVLNSIEGNVWLMLEWQCFKIVLILAEIGWVSPVAVRSTTVPGTGSIVLQY